ncbi:MAG: TldD/PmbA family protein [Hallerella porci]|uniref:Microcin-processing peptidase 2 n=1 Tax=Hallerella porci TaxID=1945871 RepID=A0ABX5LS27_9BACT|nr:MULTISPECIES: TldD/PmbA family protein [Hallerella]MCI5600118.1 TldD/PmbA family protein [Hallerella sp.]MDY3920538.1 TldD/PmbA family protein [Hallerella porci]PWL03255.1 microcin-processing peptidase 2 [Hallerella porci]
MNRDVAESILELGTQCGADYVEIYEEETRSSTLSLKDSKIETASAGTEFGIGVRLIYGTEVLYAFTSEESKDALLQMVKTLAFGREKGKSAAPKFSAEISRFGNPAKDFLDPGVLGNGYKLDFLHSADANARQVSNRICQVVASITDSCSHIHIVSSSGINVSDFRTHTRLGINVTAGRDSEKIVSREAPGALAGYECLEKFDVTNLAKIAAERSLRMLDAGYISGGVMPVVMGPGFGGVIFHEAVGHPLETEAIRHQASPFCGKLGKQIAQPCLTAIDDGTIAGSWGSCAVDDEGMKSERTVLIENGILKNYMADMVGAKEVGCARTGSGRRESYKFAPVSRMRNSFIAPGKDSFDAMIASVDHGLYAAKMAGGSVNPATGEFNFAVEEGYEIVGGKIGRPVRGATLIGKGDQVLQGISMVGSDLSIAAGVCGASSGYVPVTVGQPTIKVDSILVGGR